MDLPVSLYDEEDVSLDDLVKQRINQVTEGIVVVMQFLESLADQGESLPSGMYHFLWEKLEKIKAVSEVLDKGEDISDIQDLDHTPL